MGGFISFLCAVNEERISAVAPLVASPDWSMLFEHPNAPKTELAEIDAVVKKDPLHNYKKMVGKAVLVQNNSKDPVVPVNGVRKLDQNLKGLFFEAPDRYSYIEYSQSSHNVTNEMLGEVINWFKKFI